MEKMNIKTFLFLLIFTATLYAQSDFDIVKKRVVDDIMTSPADDTRITQLIRTIRDDGTWPNINYEDISRTGFEHRIHLSNIKEMSLAYKTSDSEYYQSSHLKALIFKSMRHWCDTDYVCDNWWYNQIYTQ